MSHVKDVTFHLLTHEDAVELLQFERAERAWFCAVPRGFVSGCAAVCVSPFCGMSRLG